jgi:hypothetical protein
MSKPNETETYEPSEYSVWSFYCPDTGVAYGVGWKEETAIRQLAKEKHALAVGYERGTLGGKGGWTMVFVEGRSQTFHRGERLPAKPPEPTA